LEALQPIAATFSAFVVEQRDAGCPMNIGLAKTCYAGMTGREVTREDELAARRALKRDDATQETAADVA